MKQIRYEPEWMHLLATYVRPIQERAFEGYSHNVRFGKNGMFVFLNYILVECVYVRFVYNNPFFYQFFVCVVFLCFINFACTIFRIRFFCVFHIQDARIEGGYESVPTRDIHLKQLDLEETWLEFLDGYVMPLQESVFVGYAHDVCVFCMFLLKKNQKIYFLTCNALFKIFFLVLFSLPDPL
jgi:hypothetical protein